MKKNTIIWIVVGIVILIIIGIIVSMNDNQSYAPASPQSSPSVPTHSTAQRSPVPGVPISPSASASSSAAAYKPVIVLNTTTSISVGTYLIASNGMTLYTYGKDSSGVSNCSGQCAVAWPPYTVSTGVLKGGQGVTGTISTITRSDGTKQLIYNGAPLYFSQADTQLGDTTGQNIDGFSIAKP